MVANVFEQAFLEGIVFQCVLISVAMLIPLIVATTASRAGSE
jgi:hypothetical protein